MKTIALALLVLGAEPPPPTLVRVLSLDPGYLAAHPCPDEAKGVHQFCTKNARVAVELPRAMKLTFQLAVYDRATGAALHEVRMFGGAAADEDVVTFATTDDVLFSIDFADPKAAPKKLGKADCGGPAAPSVHAVSNGVPLCLTRPEEDPKNQLLITGSGGVCRVPPTAWKEAGSHFALATEQLSKACRKVLKLK